MDYLRNACGLSSIEKIQHMLHYLDFCKYKYRELAALPDKI